MRREEEGVTLLGFRIKPDGTVARTVVFNSSGSSTLDQAAIDVVSNCVFKPPASDGGRDGWWTSVEYNWFLEGDPRNSLKASRLKAAADKGDAAALYHLSLIFRSAARTDDERRHAMKLLQSAAAQGHPHAQFDLGRYFEKGVSPKAKVEDAMRWYKKAAAQGDELAIERLQTGAL